jgi:hypothetical protein
VFSALYYQLPTASTSISTLVGNFRVISTLNTVDNIDPSWVLLAVLNTDASQALVKWQAGGVVLPLPRQRAADPVGQQRAAAGDGRQQAVARRRDGQCEHPGSLSVGATIGTLTLGSASGDHAGQIIGQSSDHAILLRGDTTSTTIPNYAITPGAVCSFLEWGGIWRFRQVQSGVNNLLFEINPTNVFYKSVALQRIPYRILPH